MLCELVLVLAILPSASINTEYSQTVLCLFHESEGEREREHLFLHVSAMYNIYVIDVIYGPCEMRYSQYTETYI